MPGRMTRRGLDVAADPVRNGSGPCSVHWDGPVFMPPKNQSAIPPTKQTKALVRSNRCIRDDPILIGPVASSGTCGGTVLSGGNEGAWWGSGFRNGQWRA